MPGSSPALDAHGAKGFVKAIPGCHFPPQNAPNLALSHFIQAVVGGIVEGVGGDWQPAAAAKHLHLLIIHQRLGDTGQDETSPSAAPSPRVPPSATADLHVLNHDGVGDAVGLQVGFEGLQAGEGHADVDRVPQAAGCKPEIQLEGEKTRWGGVRSGLGLPPLYQLLTS